MLELSSDIKTILAILWIIICFVWYVPYFRDIIKGTTKPHSFSWFIWWVLIGLGFFIQLSEGGGLASWVNGVTSALCFVVALFWVVKKDFSYTKLDWTCLILALVSIGLLILTKNPFYTVLLISFTDFLWFIPTYKKVYHHPYSETLSTWYLMNVRTLLWIIAFDVYNFNTVFYPTVVFFLNFSAIFLIHYRKTKITIS